MPIPMFENDQNERRELQLASLSIKQVTRFCSIEACRTHIPLHTMLRLDCRLLNGAWGIDVFEQGCLH